MPTTQCLGRLVRDTKGAGLLAFEDGGVFHIPYRCETVTRNEGGLCEACEKKEKKTAEKVAQITGSTIQGMLPSYLNGRVTEPIPFWSRLYDGAWYRLKIECGSKVSEEVMAKARKAAAVAYEGVEVVAPQPMPGGRKPRTKKTVVVEAPVVAVEPIPVVPVAAPLVAPVVAPVVAPIPPVKKVVRKPKTATLKAATLKTEAPVAAVDPIELPVEGTREVHVRSVEVDGRKLYLEPRKQKLYDLKFKYIGRLKDEKIVSFPDSDADLP
jgi:hypothetical protein